MISLNAPLSEKDVRSLKLGDTVFLHGQIITGRDEMHIRTLEYVREGKEVPKEIEGSVLFHCGPIMSKTENGWIVIAAGPTTSARMNDLEPEMIERFKIRAIVGKGGMSAKVAEAMKRTGCVYLASVGGTAVSSAESLKVRGEPGYADLGMAEAMWKLEADRFGPLIVAMDSNGESLYEKIRSGLIRV